MRHARAMTRRSTAEIPVDLPVRLEIARLDLPALFRAPGRMDLSPAEIPQRLIGHLFKLDADFVEALWAFTNLPPAWISTPCSAILWQRSTNYRKFVPGSVPSSPAALTPFWLNWKSLCAVVWTQQRPTAWCLVALPKTVQHPAGSARLTNGPSSLLRRAPEVWGPPGSGLLGSAPPRRPWPCPIR